MTPIRFAIIGCGRIAQRHALHLRQHGVLVAVCDIVPAKACEFGGLYKAAYFFSIDDLLTAPLGIDVVVICTPNGLHAAHAIAALENGHHVLVEKPMATSSADGRNMINAMIRSGRQLFTVMQNRFNPPVAAIKDALNAGAFGKISSVQLTCFWNRDEAYYTNTWKGTRELDGGTLFTQFSHFIDLLYWYFGDVKTVYAIAKNAMHHMVEFEDAGAVVIEFKSGIMGTINFSVNSFGKNREGSLSILGSSGTARIGGEYLNTIDYADFEHYRLPALQEAGEANDYGSYKGSMSNHDKVYSNLVESLSTGKSFYATPEEGLKTIEIIERIYASVRANSGQ